MAIGFPVKADYATGDVLTAANMNDLGGTLNTVPSTIGAYAAGKNKIINGDFRINQRAFTSTTTNLTYGFDRFYLQFTGGGTSTYSAQTFTAGAAPVAGYEAINFARVVTTGQSAVSDITLLKQAIEDVRTFAGQTITVSFWAKAATGTPKICLESTQFFGTGGSTNVNSAATTPSQAITTSWARYSFTMAIPSISGKTIGAGSALEARIIVSAGSNFDARTGSMGIQSNTFDIWGVQAEAGSIATPFQTASGTLQGELALCQRYYYRTSPANGYRIVGNGFGANTGAVTISTPLPVSMRVVPTTLETSAMSTFYWEGSTSGNTPNSISATSSSTENIGVISVAKTASFVAGGAYALFSNNTAAFLAFGAEL